MEVKSIIGLINRLWKSLEVISVEDNKNVIWGLFIIIVIIVLMISSRDKVDSNDGKCDICGKSEYMTIYGEEFCEEHANFAVDYYLSD